MKIQFAPTNLPLSRRLQTASVLQWVFSFLGLGECLSATVLVLYACWWFVDWETPSKGGNRVHFLSNLRVWDYMRDYFPVK
ncbi:unnamed protein product, partial [Coregonus sp. 'balchen']